MKNSNYWRKYWAKDHRIVGLSDHQQVGRFREMNDIGDSRWQETLTQILKLLKVSSGHQFLDLGGVMD